MSEKTVAQKLLIKEGRTVLAVNAPKSYKAMLGELPAGAKVVSKAAKPVDTIHLFVANHKELEEQLPTLKPLLAPGGILWVSYLKGGAKTKTDINRDTIHAYARTVGLEGVAMVSIDDDWSAMRFKLL